MDTSNTHRRINSNSYFNCLIINALLLMLDNVIHFQCFYNKVFSTVYNVFYYVHCCGCYLLILIRIVIEHFLKRISLTVHKSSCLITLIDLMISCQKQILFNYKHCFCVKILFDYFFIFI